MKLLAISGSHRKDGNSYLLSKAVLDSLGCEYEIIQLAEKDIDFCTACEACIDKACILDDDLDEILGKMKAADGLIFAVPKYLSVPSKFIAFVERLASIVHMRKHLSYAGPPVNTEYVLLKGAKPFCVFALSGRGEFNENALLTITEYLEDTGLKLVSHEEPPFVAVNVKAGDEKGEVLQNTEAVELCRDLARKLVKSVSTN